jgi:XTP/dITP diphosphohydrolase
LLLASNNPHKLREFRLALTPLKFEVLSPKDLGIRLQVAETGGSFTENALLKARAFQEAAGLVALADDSGLEIGALGGAPGVRSARLGGPNLDDRDRLQMILSRLSGTTGKDRAARFVCAIAVVWLDGREDVVERSVEGEIALVARGERGFGYDPIFFYPPLRKTFAELTDGEKALVSHRALALAALVRRLQAG